jgi:hypothetical protein
MLYGVPDFFAADVDLLAQFPVGLLNLRFRSEPVVYVMAVGLATLLIQSICLASDFFFSSCVS